MQFFHSRTAVALLIVIVLLLSSAFCQDNSAAITDAHGLILLGKFKDAEAGLRLSIAAHSSSAEAHFLLAYVLLRENLPKESLTEYTQAARLRTPSAADLRNVAFDYVLLKDYPDAEKWTLRALEMDKSDPETWYSLGRIRYSTGKLLDAVDCFRHALVLAPRSVKAETNLGLAYEGLNQVEKAGKSYQTAIEMQRGAPNPSAQPLIDLAILRLHHADLPEALALLQQAVQIDPNDPRVHEQLGLVYLEQNQLPEAQTHFEKAVALSPQDGRMHFLLGRVYRREGMVQKAQDEFARTSSLNGTRSTPPE